MKKCFYVILAAAAIVASCAKTDLKEDQKFEPKDSATALFSGSIVQPNGLNTKTTLVDDQDDQVSIAWEKDDEIVVKANNGDVDSYYSFFADKAGIDVYFGCTSDKVSEVSAWLLDNDCNGYTAYYPAYTYPSLPGILDCASEQYGNQASLQNMPLKAVLNSVSLSSHDGRELSFSSPNAILQFTVPSTLDADTMKVYLNEDTDCFVSVSNFDELEADESGNKVFYAPIPAEEEGYKLTFVAKKTGQEEAVATMSTYGNTPEIAANTIYYFDFCNTLTISEAGTYKLVNNGIDYKINVSAAIEGTVTFQYEEGEGVAPANISINARGYKIGYLDVNTPNSHVVVSNGESVSAKAITSLNTFVVKGDYKITGTEEGEGLTVEKGNVVIEGVEGATNVAQVLIPENVTEQIKIDVSGVSTSNESERVKIINESTEATVVVVPDVVGDQQQSYQVEVGSEPVIQVTKETVAMIGDTGYETLKAAVDAVPVGNQSTVTIKVIKDVVLKKADALNINKNNVVLDGQGYTIALDETDTELAKYLVNSTDTESRKYGRFQMITVSGENVTLKNMTLDSKNYRGASLATTVGGKNASYENILYKGLGSGHYYGSAAGNGTLKFNDCTFETHGYAIHTAECAVELEVSDCEIHGWVSYGDKTKSATFTNTRFYSTTDQYNGVIATIRPYCATTITNCTFSKEYLTKYKYDGLTVRKNVVVSLNGCSVEGEGNNLYDIANITCPDDPWVDGGVIAIDASGNATDGFTAGTFVAKQASDIKVAGLNEVVLVEGKENVFTIAPKQFDENTVAFCNGVGYETLQEAFDAARTAMGGTITLVADVVLAKTINWNGADPSKEAKGDGDITDCSNKYTFDLNGYHVTPKEGTSCNIQVKGCEFNIKDSKGDGYISNPNGFGFGFNANREPYLDNCGVLNIYGGEYIGKNSDPCGQFSHSYGLGSSGETNDGYVCAKIINIYDGEFQGLSCDIARVNIRGGHFTSYIYKGSRDDTNVYKYDKENDAIFIYGGKFDVKGIKQAKEGTFDVMDITKDYCHIYAGDFNFDPTACVEEGSSAQKVGDRWIVTQNN